MMNDTPAKRLANLLRERHAMLVRMRRGEITREECSAAFRRMVLEARLNEPNLGRPAWADDLAWFMRALAQAVWSGVLRDGEHVAILRRNASWFRGTPRPGFRHAPLDECSHLAVHLDSALPAMGRFGFDLSHAEVLRALAVARDMRPGFFLATRGRIYFGAVRGRCRAVVLDWVQVQALGASPRRTDS